MKQTFSRRRLLAALMLAPAAGLPAVAAAPVIKGRGLTSPIMHIDELGFRSTAYNTQASRQNDFAEAFFPMVVVNPS